MLLLKKDIFKDLLRVILFTGVCFLQASNLFAQETSQPENPAQNGTQKLVYTEKQNAMRIKANDIRLVE